MLACISFIVVPLYRAQLDAHTAIHYTITVWSSSPQPFGAQLMEAWALCALCTLVSKESGYEIPLKKAERLPIPTVSPFSSPSIAPLSVKRTVNRILRLQAFHVYREHLRADRALANGGGLLREVAVAGVDFIRTRTALQDTSSIASRQHLLRTSVTCTLRLMLQFIVPPANSKKAPYGWTLSD
ncbi:uncharacterized protein K452DRAFT_286076 [Aplosporella prunicola CBS 121167]|uniref:Uncharacterized protein n=1 Tax=Aplosporella prunicola CBS 121167 TaxID=1176127 RepID=A0A6A6BIZ6_9PEZI|nr:uncharacterized protein K452DRAFT_286076 [Aplosporella prunicola CBS 121167]KAF2143254.1 hypothetical protein K452DRAFT_286076 [Aplosporella prunicola CBS 121167]